MGIRKTVYISFFIALGIVIPMVVHLIGGPGLGRVILPMHLPVLIGGALLGPLAGIIIGLLTPILSFLFTGMPPLIPVLPIMIGELGVYGLIMGYFYYEFNINMYIALIISMITGRIMASVIVMILVFGFRFTQLPTNPLFYIYGTITMGLPGIIGQVILIPIVLRYINRYNNAHM
jgi:riboflavin transporter FmnP